MISQHCMQPPENQEKRYMIKICHLINIRGGGKLDYNCSEYAILVVSNRLKFSLPK